MRKILFSFVLVFATLFTNAIAEDSPKAVIVFDASGSMWGQIKGKSKIEIARDALKNVVNEWNPKVELGLTVYGHRRKGDCNDIESVIPVGKVDKDKIIKRVMGIQPKGKTPISRSLRKVADELKYTEEKATIILISDGKETCDADPCSVAKELEKKGIDFVTHVIGFNVDKSTDKQLECIAKATGGEYFSAKNASALNDAMKSIVKKVEKVEPPKPKAKKLENNLEVTASETEGGKWVKARIDAIKDKDGKKLKYGYSTGEKEPYITQLPIGKYTLDMSYNEFKKKDIPVEIKAGETTKVHVVFGQTGKVFVSASETEGGKWLNANCRIYNEDKSDDWVIYPRKDRDSSMGYEQLPVGKYSLNCEYNAFKKKDIPVEIKAGETTKVHVVFGQTGKVFVSASETEGGKWLNANCRIYNEDRSDDWVIYPRKDRDSSMGYEQLPVGKYFLNCEYNAFEKKDIPVEIKAGETTKVHVVFGQTGKVFVSASETEGGKWLNANCRIYNEDRSDDWVIYPRKDRDSSMGYEQLPVGKYFLNCEYNAFEKKDIPVEIKAGETTKVHVVFAPFHISVQGITPCSNLHFELIAKSGETVVEKDAPAYKGIDFVVSKGKYMLEVTLEDKKIKKSIDVGAGENSAIVDFGGDDTLNSIEGVWKTSEGKATIGLDGKKVYGYYSNDNGELIGEMTYPKRFEGFWIEDNSDEKCSTAKNGRYYWGKVIWKFDDKMCSFKGKYSYCNKKPNHSWRGSYIRPLNDSDKHNLLMKDDTKNKSKEETKTENTTQNSNKEANKNLAKTITIGDKVINIESLSDDEIKKLQDMKKMLEIFGNKK